MIAHPSLTSATRVGVSCGLPKGRYFLQVSAVLCAKFQVPPYKCRLPSVGSVFSCRNGTVRHRTRSKLCDELSLAIKLRGACQKSILFRLKRRLGGPLAVRDCAQVLYKYAIFFVPECGVPRQVVQRLSIGPAPSGAFPLVRVRCRPGALLLLFFFLPMFFFIFLPPVMSLAIQTSWL